MNEKFTHAIIIIGIFVLALMISTMDKGPSTINLGPADLRNRITVTGNSEVTVDPDVADIYVRIESKGASASVAQDANSVASDSVIKALKSAGLKSDEIQTSSYNIWENKYWDPQKNREISSGYNVQHVLKATTNDVKDVGTLLDAAVKAGATGIDRISFRLSKAKQMDVNSQALSKASELAGAKAKNIANSLGVSLGEIIRVSESNYNYQPYEYYPGVQMRAMDESAVSAPSISPQDVNVRATIGIEYEIK